MYSLDHSVYQHTGSILSDCSELGTSCLPEYSMEPTISNITVSPSNHNTIDEMTRGNDWQKLPVEVISMIVGHLDRGDLKNCRLVDKCTGFQATCWLFRTIHLWPTARSVHAARIVGKYPKLSAFVHCLEWHWEPLACQIHFAYQYSMDNGIDSFESLGHPYIRDLLRSFSRLNAFCYTKDWIGKPDGVCMLHGSLPRRGGMRPRPPRSKAERLVNTILVLLKATQMDAVHYDEHVEFAPITWDTFCTYMDTVDKSGLRQVNHFKVIFERRDCDYSLTLTFHAPGHRRSLEHRQIIPKSGRNAEAFTFNRVSVGF